jgi:hypothetical protein
VRLQRLCWEPRGGFYIAMTDTGWFKVPNAPGGWAARTPWEYSMVCKPPPADLHTVLVFLGMKAPSPPASRVHCVGRGDSMTAGQPRPQASTSGKPTTPAPSNDARRLSSRSAPPAQKKVAAALFGARPATAVPTKAQPTLVEALRATDAVPSTSRRVRV